ncbi:unnamed protein product, partial [Prorocentrum cordatum]
PGSGGSGVERRGVDRCCARELAREREREAIYTVAAALNFAVFLRHGVFCALSDRLLGIRMVHIDPTARRQVAFEQMNRVMMWNGMRELLMTAVPLVDLSRVRRRLTRALFPEA